MVERFCAVSVDSSACPLCLPPYALALEPILRRLRNILCSLALFGISVPVGDRARIFAYTEDVCIFRLCHSDTAVVQKTFERYEVTGVKIKRISSVLRLGAWVGVALPGTFS